MKLDGFGIMVGDMKKMVQFYHDAVSYTHLTLPTT